MENTADIREQALQDLQRAQVLMLNGHFDYGNGYHGRAYLNPGAWLDGYRYAVVTRDRIEMRSFEPHSS